jgi:hypothetical protein
MTALSSFPEPASAIVVASRGGIGGALVDALKASDRFDTVIGLSRGDREPLDLLDEAGYEYVMDWPADDQPFWMRTRKGRILSIPYSIELNDSPAMVFRQHSGEEFERMMIDQFDEMLHQSQKRPLVYTAVLHPFVVGQPFRLRALRRAMAHILEHRDEIWLTTPGEIAGYCAGMPDGVIPGS